MSDTTFNVLLLVTFPIDNPTHGGQIRTSEISKMYQSMGASVQVVGVLGGSHYEASRHFVEFPGGAELQNYIDESFLMVDWAIGKLFSRKEEWYEKLVSKIKDVPDLIHVELPWLFEFAERYKAEYCEAGTPLVYGSENIESRTKYAILRSYVKERSAREAEALVEATEVYALKNADLVCAVVENDITWFKDHTKSPLVLARNGVSDVKPSLIDLRAATRITGTEKYAFFAGSSYPPNIQGFFDVFKSGLLCLAPTERLVIGGGASTAIMEDPRAKSVTRLGRAVVPAGIVPEGTLKGLVHNAHVIVLPITQGGGSNLKTAEALWSGAHVVGTPVAFRGYESYLDCKGVHVAETPADFARLLRQCMDSPILQLDERDWKKRRGVLWEETLKTFKTSVETIMAGRG